MKAFAAYFLPITGQGHQLDRLSEFVDKPIVVNSFLWPECNHRIHGVFKDELVCLCTADEADVSGEVVTPEVCLGCEVRCGRLSA